MTLGYLLQFLNQQSVEWFVRSERFSKGEHNCIFSRLQLYRVSSPDLGNGGGYLIGTPLPSGWYALVAEPDTFVKA